MMKKLKGQALIIGLLFIVIVSTIVLAFVSRSLKDVKISTESQKELRSFSAAEAGLEKALNNPQSFLAEGQTQVQVGNINVNVSTEKAQWGKNIAFTYPDNLVQDEVRQFFLTQYDDTTHSLNTSEYYNAGKLSVLWGKVNSNGSPAGQQPGVEITLYYQDNNDGGKIKTKRFAYDAQGRGNFSTSVDSVGGSSFTTTFGTKRFAYRATLNFNLNPGQIPLFLRTRFLFNGQVQHPLGFAVPSGENPTYYPTQGYKITSQANKGENDSAVQRLEAFKSFPILPSAFDYALYSGSSLEVN